MSEAVDIAVLDEVEAELTPPADAARLLLWLDTRAERLRELRVRMSQDEAAEKLRRARWEERRAKEAARALALETDMRNACEAMRDTVLPGTTKSRTLPSGASVAFRKRPLRLEVQNEAAMVAWAQEHHGDVFISWVPHVDMSGLRDNFKTHGEVPDGCSVAGGDETFRITTDGE